MDRNLKRFATFIALLNALTSAHGDTTFYDAVVWDFGSSFTINSGIVAKFMPGSTVDATGATLVGFPGGTGASSFLGLTDTPDAYAGQAGKFVAVNAGQSALEFVTAPGGGGGGTVTNFSSGNLAPVFNTTVVNPTTAPAQSFTLLSAGAHMFLGNETGATAVPHYVQPSFTDLVGDLALTQTPSLAAGALVGRTSTGPGDWQAITPAGGLLVSGTTLIPGPTIGNVLNSGTPTADQLPIWVDATHIKGVPGLTGGSVGQVLKKSTNANYEWEWAADIAGGGGSSTFITLTDVPPSYTGAAGKLVAVNLAANGLEFITAPAGGGGVSSVFGRTGAVTAAVGDYAAFYQPLDTDLTNIAGLAGQTAFGRGFLTQADASASRTYIGAGTSDFDGTWASLTGKPTTLAGFGITDAQPLDADLTSLAATTGLNTLYYRSAANTWSSVTMGGNMTFGSGILNAANSNWDTAYSERRQWDGGATGLIAATGRTSLGLDIGVNVQAFDADLSSLAAATSTNSLYYRSAANTWAPVTIGGNMTFVAGTLNATTGGDVTGPVSSADLGFALYSGTTGKVIRATTSSGMVVSTSGVFGTITDNSANWNTAYTQTRQWDGGATGLVAATGRTSLALNNVTNDVQTKASVVPNTAPAAGQLPVGSGTAYVPRTVSGSGATVTMGSTGVITVDAIANTSLANSSITIGNAGATALGGSAGADAILGMTGVGLIKRTTTNSYDLAVAGTDYKVGTQNTVNVRLIVATGATTFTPTAGVTALYVECVGGGGGGGGIKMNNSTSSMAGSGAGGGGYANAYIGTPAGSYSVNVGVGGTAGPAIGGLGGDGGSTNFGAACTATGGQNGWGAAGAGTGGFAPWQPGGVGGTGTVGTMRITGSDGGIAISCSDTAALGGTGGGSTFAGETTGSFGVGGATTGAAGSLYGGGGAGGAAAHTVTGAAGGAGGQGIIRVWEIF